MAKASFYRGKVRQKLSAPYAKCQTEQSENCNCDDAYFSGAQRNAHNQRQRNGRRDGENTPRTLGKRLNHHQRQNSQQNDHDRQDTNESEQADAGPDFLLYHLTKRFAAAPDRREQNDHVMDTSAKRCADQNPKRPRQESELRSEHRSNQRPGSSNRDRKSVV